jgi:predicted acyltransferase
MKLPARVLSIDVFRAVTMLLMIFVNDFWTLKDIPQWLEHSRADVDFLGLSDVVFPCFLFIVGLSIPFAVHNRLAKGDTTFQLLWHIAWRSVALLVMGVFTVNTPDLNAETTGMRQEYYTLLMVLGFFLVWNVYPKATDYKRYVFIGLQLLGASLLVWLAVVFKGNAGNEIVGFRTQWWGILGLIGWAYLGSAVLYVFIRKTPILVPVLWGLFTLLNLADHAGWLAAAHLQTALGWIPGAGAFHCFAFAGMTASLLLYQYSLPKHLLVAYLLLGVGLLIGGFVARHFFIISKIYATPTWIFLCTGIAFLAYTFLYWLVDLRKKAHWFEPIKPAGTQTLTSYVVPYAYYSLAALYGFTIPEILKTGALGLLKSLIYAGVIIAITALLGRLHIRLKV